MARTIRGKVTLLLVNRRSVLLLAAAAANIKSAAPGADLFRQYPKQKRGTQRFLFSLLWRKVRAIYPFSRYVSGNQRNTRLSLFLIERL